MAFLPPAAPDQGSRNHGAHDVLDIICLGGGLLGFAACFAYVALCERL
jgi:hypothetical protein